MKNIIKQDNTRKLLKLLARKNCHYKEVLELFNITIIGNNRYDFGWLLFPDYSEIMFLMASGVIYTDKKYYFYLNMEKLLDYLNGVTLDKEKEQVLYTPEEASEKVSYLRKIEELEAEVVYLRHKLSYLRKILINALEDGDDSNHIR